MDMAKVRKNGKVHFVEKAIIYLMKYILSSMHVVYA